MPFDELGLPAALVDALAKEDIREPLAIQTLATPVLLAGKDAYLRSETGTGKTLAYLLPLFCRVDTGLAVTQVVVLAPTHELASQIQQQVLRLAQNAGWPLRTLLLIGGASLPRQVERLKTKPHLVVGSPGRILDLLRMRKLKVQAVRALVVDEADRLLSGETQHTVREVVKAIPRERQMVFVSATEQQSSSAEAVALAPGLTRLDAGSHQVNADIEHLYVVCDERDKPDVLRRLIRALEPQRAIAFVHRNTSAEQVAARMAHYHLAVADLHGARDKVARRKAMDDIRSGRARLLIASDLAARGMDIRGVTHVFNVDVPTQSMDYLHRAGRTGRAGQRGYAVSLMTPRETRLVARYVADLGITMTEVVTREGQVFAVERSSHPRPEHPRPGP